MNLTNGLSSEEAVRRIREKYPMTNDHLQRIIDGEDADTVFEEVYPGYAAMIQEFRRQGGTVWTARIVERGVLTCLQATS